MVDGETKTSKSGGKLTPYIIPFITCLLGMSGTLAVQRYTGRLRNLEYIVNTSAGLLKTPDISGKQLRLSIDGKLIANASSVAVYLYNRTDQDYEDVPVEISFPARTKIIQSRYASPVSAPEVRPSTQPAPSSDGSIRYLYSAKIANRTDKPFMAAEYLLEGSIAREPSVFIQKKGIEAQRVENLQPKDISNWTFVFMLGYLMVVTTVFFGISIRLQILGSRRERRFLEQLQARTKGMSNDQLQVWLEGQTTKARGHRRFDKQQEKRQ